MDLSSKRTRPSVSVGSQHSEWWTLTATDSETMAQQRLTRLRVPLFRPLFVGILAALLFGLATANSAEVRDQQAMKAAFIFQFVNFVEWPSDQPDQVTIGVLGSDSLYDALVALGDRRSDLRPILIRRYSSLADAIDGLHVLIIGTSERDRLATILDAVATSPVLTVSDIDAFAEEGGIIGFVRKGARQKFTVNRSAAALANLSLRQELLRVAILVD